MRRLLFACASVVGLGLLFVRCGGSTVCDLDGGVEGGGGGPDACA